MVTPSILMHQVAEVLSVPASAELFVQGMIAQPLWATGKRVLRS